MPLKKKMSSRKWLSRPLEHGKKLNVDTGSFPHDDIIGTYPRSKIFETRGKRLNKYILSAPTTEEYINMTGRDAQPIYPFDAAAMVSLADLNIDYPELDSDRNLVLPPQQYFEAGTGHGSLTLQICKALHAANAYAKFTGDISKRGAILHSIDCNEHHSKTGQRTIRNFKNGMYLNDVEFHISESPTKWLQDEADEWRNLSPQNDQEKQFDEPEAFLSGIFLDMGGFENHLEETSKNLLLDAPMLVFCPSLSQVMDALKIIDKNPQIRLQFVRTVQLPPGAGGGLKEWDTRKTHIKATDKDGWVCRPKVGVRVCGGGFILIFRKPATNIDIGEQLQEIKDYIPPVKEEYDESKEKIGDNKEATANANDFTDANIATSESIEGDNVDTATDKPAGTATDETEVSADSSNASTNQA